MSARYRRLMKCKRKYFRCKECGNDYTANDILRRHVTKKHSHVEVDDIAPKLNAIRLNLATGRHCCDICDKTFSHKSNLHHHRKNVHKIFASKLNANRCCLCSFASVSLTRGSRADLRKHYRDEHGLKIEVEMLEFDSMEAFVSWKENVEKDCQSKFVKPRGDQKDVGGSVVSYFVCHRSGNYVPSGKGERRLKTQGSNKINGVCPASMTLRLSDDSKVDVQFIKTHVGHEYELGRSSTNISAIENGVLAGHDKFANPVDSDHNYGIFVIDCCNESAASECEVAVMELPLSERPNDVFCDLEAEKSELKRKLWEEIDRCTTFDELQVICKFMEPIKSTLAAMRKGFENVKPVDVNSFNENLKEFEIKSSHQRTLSTKKFGTGKKKLKSRHSRSYSTSL